MNSQIELIKEHTRESLNQNRVSRDIISLMLDHEHIVLEDGIVTRLKSRYSANYIKNALRKLTENGLLDTGAEANTRWYCFRRECKNHFTAKIIPDKKYREQLENFISIYD